MEETVGASGIGGRPGTVGSQVPREGLKRVGMAKGCREAKERAGKGREAATLETCVALKGAFWEGIVCGVLSERQRSGES